ncbi:MAG: hypothetical protein Q3962_09285 [Corynebacterium sp.]|nr:hypothetical protein [Corynebacterium sp.]
MRFSFRQWGILVALVLCIMLLVFVGFFLAMRGNDRQSGASSLKTAANISVVPLDDNEASNFSAPDSAFYNRLSSVVDNVRSRYQGSVGLALIHVDNPSRSLVIGDRLVAPAWATLHVPIALASLHEGADMDKLLNILRETDTEAVVQLYGNLGEDGADKVETVLRAGGDLVTSLPANYPRPCNYTSWSLYDQAVWLSHLSLIKGGDQILDAMTNYSAAETYGLGHVANARFKSGWGTDFTGAFSVRQFGMVKTDRGDLAVSFLVHAGDGSFGTAQVMANELVDQVLAIPGV